MDGLTLRMSLNVRYGWESGNLNHLLREKLFAREENPHIHRMDENVNRSTCACVCVYVLAEVVSEMSTPVKNP